MILKMIQLDCNNKPQQPVWSSLYFFWISLRSRCRTRGASEDSIPQRQQSTQLKESTLALIPGEDVSRSTKKGLLLNKKQSESLTSDLVYDESWLLFIFPQYNLLSSALDASLSDGVFPSPPSDICRLWPLHIQIPSDRSTRSSKKNSRESEWCASERRLEHNVQDNWIQRWKSAIFFLLHSFYYSFWYKCIFRLPTDCYCEDSDSSKGSKKTQEIHGCLWPVVPFSNYTFLRVHIQL